jgi:DNA-binding transcriptional regulator YiaG
MTSTTPTEFKRALESLGLSQAEFARHLAVSPQACSSWATGRVAVPGHVAVHLGVLQGLQALSAKHLEKK